MAPTTTKDEAVTNRAGTVKMVETSMVTCEHTHRMVNG
jgi:hypothetical protein